MSKKRKKSTLQKKTSISELNMKRRKAEILEKTAFFETMNKLSAELRVTQSIQDRLGEYESEKLFYSRFRKPNVKAGSELKFPQKVLKSIQMTVDNFLKNNFFKLPGGRREFSYYEYFTCFLTLKSSISCGTGSGTSPFQGMKEDYHVLFDLIRSKDSPEIHFLKFLSALGNCLSYPTQFDIELSNHYRMIKGTDPYLACIVEISISPVHGKKVLFQDKLQTVFPLSVQASTRVDIRIPISALYPKSAMTKEDLSLYFQRHAIDRLMERIDCVSELQVFTSLITSFLNPETIKISDSKFLISYYVDRIKLGYFVLIVSEGIAVVKTFLFLTNDGTPEGNRLKSILKMSKYEKRYFSLDKLSSFYHSDITKDYQIKRILKKSRCPQLIEIKSKINTFQKQSNNFIPSSLPTINSLRNYIQVGNVA